MTFKIFQGKLSPKGITLIFILQPINKKIQTGYYCKPGSWNQSKQIVLTGGSHKDPNGAAINSELRKASVFLENLLETESNILQIRKKYKSRNSVSILVEQDNDSEIMKSWHTRTQNVFRKCLNKELFMQVERIIFDHRTLWSKSYQNHHRTVITKIISHNPEFAWEDIGEKWWKSYVSFCLESLGNTSNTVHADVPIVKSLAKIMGCQDLRGITWSYVDTKKKGLKWDKVLIIRQLDLSQSEFSYTIKDTQTLWLVSAFTGRRFEEISNAGKLNFYKKDNHWRYRNIGKKQKTIDVRLIPEAVEYLESINFSFPKKMNPRYVNADIKEICRLAGFNDPVEKIIVKDRNKIEKKLLQEWQTVTFHTARHSYAHHIVKLSAGEPFADQYVSAKLGHASPQTTWRYRNMEDSDIDRMDDEIFK